MFRVVMGEGEGALLKEGGAKCQLSVFLSLMLFVVCCVCAPCSESGDVFLQYDVVCLCL